jgi:hypothetical protein
MGSPLIAYKMEIWSEETPFGVVNFQYCWNDWAFRFGALGHIEKDEDLQNIIHITECVYVKMVNMAWDNIY